MIRAWAWCPSQTGSAWRDMEAVFSVEAWSAFAPGLDGDAAWLAWSRAPWLPHGDDVPALQEMAPMQRRRVERLGRAALQVAWRCQPDDQSDIPLVFATRHGDIGRTQLMLSELARDQALSPTQLMGSVQLLVMALPPSQTRMAGTAVRVSRFRWRRSSRGTLLLLFWP